MRKRLYSLFLASFCLGSVVSLGADPLTLAVALQRGDEGTTCMQLSAGTARLPNAFFALDVSPSMSALLVPWDHYRDSLVVFARDSSGAFPQEALLAPAVLAFLRPASGNTGRLAAWYDTPLMASARCGDCTMVVQMLRTGTEPCLRNPLSGERASEIARAAGHAEAAGILAAYENGIHLLRGSD
jgi:hypothetical protein